jgi:hypothetical protein
MAGKVEIHIYSTARPGDVMVFAKPPQNVSRMRRLEKSAMVRAV